MAILQVRGISELESDNIYSNQGMSILTSEQELRKAPEAPTTTTASSS